ncbi:MAG: purine-nucleoside phosphorylase [Clostridiales bacterium]|nr:purine-nucleoside phosphorylase [Clostridiales bacterium]
MSMHISAAPGEIAPDVILPGDPLRARYIAETYLTDVTRVNEIRNAWGYTGYYKGKRISVMSTGMGAPSMMIYATELCREYGCKTLIRLGTAGAIPEHIRLGDIVLSQGISTTSGMNDYILPGHYSSLADFEMLDQAYHLAKERSLKVYVGNTLTNDHLYVDDKLEYCKQWEKYGLLACEQEGVALYTAAARFHVKALMMLSIVMNMYRPEETVPDAVKESGLDSIITLALDTLLIQKGE